VGYNTTFRSKNKLISTHAEVQALKNANPHTLKNQIVDLFVIRVAKGGSLCSSRPCVNCVTYMAKMSKKYNFVIKNIYYTDSVTTVIRKSLPELLADPHTTKFQKKLF